MKILIAKEDAFLNDELDRQVLTVGKIYNVIKESDNKILIIDDEGDDHSFTKDKLNRFFRVFV